MSHHFYHYGKNTTGTRGTKYQAVQGNAGHEAGNPCLRIGGRLDAEKVSQLEAKEKIEADILEQVAKILKVSPDAIQRFNEEAAINIISSTFHDSASGVNYQCEMTFNPLDKLIEAYEENKKLYERLIEAEKEKVAYLEKLVTEK